VVAVSSRFRGIQEVSVRGQSLFRAVEGF